MGGNFNLGAGDTLTIIDAISSLGFQGTSGPEGSTYYSTDTTFTLLSDDTGAGGAGFSICIDEQTPAFTLIRAETADVPPPPDNHKCIITVEGQCIMSSEHEVIGNHANGMYCEWTVEKDGYIKSNDFYDVQPPDDLGSEDVLTINGVKMPQGENTFVTIPVAAGETITFVTDTATRFNYGFTLCWTAVNPDSP